LEELRKSKTIAGKVKVQLSLCLTKYHAMKTYWGVEVYHHAFLTLILDGDKWLASSPGGRAFGTHWIGS
jgi:hypothetical protein